MEKSIKIGSKSVKLSNNLAWTMIYRDQFGRDIIPALMPMLASAMDVISGLVSEVGTDSVSLEDILKLTDGDYIINAIIHLGGLEFVDFINITWAMAKAADDNIPGPKEWIREFNTFPLDVVAPVVGDLILKGCVSSKNLARLKNLKKVIQPSNSTRSSSPDLSEA